MLAVLGCRQLSDSCQLEEEAYSLEAADKANFLIVVELHKWNPDLYTKIEIMIFDQHYK